MAMGGASSIGSAMLGHPTGALGGATGGANAGIGGIINYQGVTEKYQEARDNAIDMHNFQLDNIKALPSSLSKVDSFNNNNKIFPILEEYSCTDEEKEIFKDKIKYEGMTINAIGKLVSYIKQNDELTFVKGKIIRLEDLAEDSHLLYTIYEEIAKGVYL
jgi:pimeloyl-CoA synthetase